MNVEVTFWILVALAVVGAGGFFIGYPSGYAAAQRDTPFLTVPSLDYEAFKAKAHAELRADPWYALGWMWANREDIPAVCYSQAAFQLGALEYGEWASKPEQA